MNLFSLQARAPPPLPRPSSNYLSLGPAPPPPLLPCCQETAVQRVLTLLLCPDQCTMA